MFVVASWCADTTAAPSTTAASTNPSTTPSPTTTAAPNKPDIIKDIFEHIRHTQKYAKSLCRYYKRIYGFILNGENDKKQ
ncbi:unnamed protein product [Colias eurytheme]|nr:unnamed protein product [Colias eurytheme]